MSAESGSTDVANVPRLSPAGSRSRNVNAWVLFWLAIYAILVVKLTTIQELGNGPFFAGYSLAVSAYILSRFAVAAFHEHDERMFRDDFRPAVTFGVPCKNEGDNVRETILRIAAVDYPRHLFEIIAVNDGSTDNTLAEMYAAQAAAAQLGVRVRVIDWTVNRGKREGMAACVRESDSEILVFIDSDSFVAPDITEHLVKYFVDPRVAAVAGHAYVANGDVNFLTKMQAVRYFVAFKAYKGAESVFGTVTCCSGCCSAYRRAHLLEVLQPWLEQRFLGITCTYGDDRSLTNRLLERGLVTLYSPKATAWTIVPDTVRAFMRQQLRWKKSWIRESLIASRFIWRRNPLMSIPFFLGLVLPLIAPIVVLRAMLWYPLAVGRPPWFYLVGLMLMALVYGLYYKIYSGDNKWVYGTAFAVFYTLVLIWQLPAAILSLRDGRWGTR